MVNHRVYLVALSQAWPSIHLYLVFVPTLGNYWCDEVGGVVRELNAPPLNSLGYLVERGIRWKYRLSIHFVGQSCAIWQA